MSSGSVDLVVEGHDSTDPPTVELHTWCRVAEETLRHEGIGAGRLDLIFVDSPTMADLNREHLGGHGPTDVLAFPLDGPLVAAGEHESAGDASGGPPAHLGDVVVCRDVAAQQARDHAATIEAELTLLVVHGVLHVLGHDHAEPDERALMQARERAHLGRHGIEHPVVV